jgi:hypothetical protein
MSAGEDTQLNSADVNFAKNSRDPSDFEFLLDLNSSAFLKCHI